jgi:hypothetical protein
VVNLAVHNMHFGASLSGIQTGTIDVIISAIKTWLLYESFVKWVANEVALLIPTEGEEVAFSSEAFIQSQSHGRCTWQQRVLQHCD